MPEGDGKLTFSIERQVWIHEGKIDEINKRVERNEKAVNEMPQRLADAVREQALALKEQGMALNARMDRHETVFETRTTKQDQKLDKIMRVLYICTGGGFVLGAIITALEAAAAGHIWPFNH